MTPSVSHSTFLYLCWLLIFPSSPHISACNLCFYNSRYLITYRTQWRFVIVWSSWFGWKSPCTVLIRHMLKSYESVNNGRTIFLSSPCFFAASSNRTVTGFQTMRQVFGPLFRSLSGDMTQDTGRHDYKFRVTWLQARWLSGDHRRPRRSMCQMNILTFTWTK